MDDADRAEIEQERWLARCLEAARQACCALESADVCVECGEQISSERQLAVPGCQLCTDCAAELERRRALFRGTP